MWNSWDKGNIIFGLHKIYCGIFVAGKGKDQGRFGGKTTIRMEEQGDRKEQLHVERSMIIMLLWSFLVPGYQRLFCLLTEFHCYQSSF